jgi:hypothetical protein
MIDLDLCIVLYDNRKPTTTSPIYYKNFWDTKVFVPELNFKIHNEFDVDCALRPYNARLENITGRDHAGMYNLRLVVFDTIEDKLAFILEWS